MGVQVSRLGANMREWILEATFKGYSLMLPFYFIALGLTVFVFVPLTLWRKTRGVGSTALFIASYIFGLTTWLFGATITFSVFGWFGLILGLLFLGVGVVPLAIIGAIFQLGNLELTLFLSVMFVITIGSRIAALIASSKTN